MAKNVYLCYVSQDLKQAQTIRKKLENYNEDIQCFLAKDDIQRGLVWADEKKKAIEDAKMMVVIFSEHFNDSPQVEWEIEEAARAKKPICVFRLSKLPFQQEVKEYYLQKCSQIDAHKNIDGSYQKLCETVFTHLGLSTKNNASYTILTSHSQTIDGQSTPPIPRSPGEKMPKSVRPSNKQDAVTPNPQGVKHLRFTVGNVPFDMVEVKGGAFWMGATAEQPTHKSDEFPCHRVTLRQYYMGETPVTQELWRAVMNVSLAEIITGNEWTNHGIGDNFPMYDLNYDNCVEFINRLNALRLCDGCFRLPTEAEWEFAARGGIYCQGYRFSGGNTLREVGWNWNNSGDRNTCGDWDDFNNVINNGCCTHPVKSLSFNELGIFDMSGNVWEFCQDSYDPYDDKSQVNPVKCNGLSSHVMRGGCWFSKEECCRVSSRKYIKHLEKDDVPIGLRLVLSLGRD